MMPSVIKVVSMPDEDKKLKKIALLVSCATILQVAESFFPQVVPGVKLGLANMIVLIALVDMGFRSAIEIAVMRTVISSLILGTFLSPSFILSFSSAITSTLAMGLVYKLLSGGGKPLFSLIGISIIGAMAHNLTQISIVYLLLIKNTGVFMLLPWLGISSVITGWVTGVVASQVCSRLERNRTKGGFKVPAAYSKKGPFVAPKFNIGRYISKDSHLHSLSPEIKILAIIVLAIIVVISEGFYEYFIVLAMLILVIAMTKIPVMRFFDGVKRLYLFIAFSFAIPMFFSYGGVIVMNFGILRITQDGLYHGSLFAFRLILLMIGAAVLIRTTSPQELASGIKSLLRPFKFTGISGDRVSRIVTSSLLAIPVLWENAHAFIKNYKIGKKKVKGLILALSSLIVMLYMKSEDDTLDLI